MIERIQIESYAWSCRTKDEIVIRKDFFEVLDNEGTNLTSFLVVSIVVTRWQTKGTQHDTTFDFITKALATSVYVDVIQVLGIFRTETIANAIETLQVWRGFRWSNDVVDSNPVFRMRQADFLDCCSQFFKVLSRIEDGFFNFWVNPFPKVFLRKSNLHAFDVLTNLRSKIGYADWRRCWILSIFTGNNIEQLGIFLNSLWERTNLVKWATKSNETETRNRSVSWLKANNPVKGSRLADRATCIWTKRQTDLTWSYSCCRTTRWPTRNLAVIPSILGCSIVRSLTRSTHGKFIHVSFPDDNHIFSFGISNRCRIKNRLVVIEHFWGRSRQNAVSRDIVFDSEWNPWQEVVSIDSFFVNGLSLCKGSFFCYCHKGIDCFFTRLDIVNGRLCQFGCWNFLRDKEIVQLFNGFIVEWH